METIEIQVFTFEELNSEAQRRALEDYRRSHPDMPWDLDWVGSLEQAQKELGIEFTCWEFDPWGGNYRFLVVPEGAEELVGVRLWKWMTREWEELLKKRCPFTGYYGDEQFLGPIRKFLRRPGLEETLENILQDCFYEFVQAYGEDYAYYQSDEFIKTEFLDYETRFLKDGSRTVHL